MKSSIKFNILTVLCALATGAVVLWGCSKGSNNSYEVYGPLPDLTPTFTVTPLPGTDARFVITNTTAGDFIATKWDLGKDTSGGTMGKTIDTAFFPLPGTYTINMYAVDKRGKMYKAQKPVTVTTTLRDPAFDNLIKGGKMNPGDEQYWKTFNQNPNKLVTWTIKNNAYNASIVTPVASGVTPNGGIYQAVQVVANKKYRFTMNAAYGVPNVAWLEIYLGATEPTNGADYTDGTKRFGYITWNNWVAFSGVGTAEITPGWTGTAYFVIKAGCNASGSFGASGFDVTNVDFKRTQE